MDKPTLFYFIHAHGNGHRATFNMLYPELSVCFRVVAITTNREITDYINLNYEIDVLELPPKYPNNYEIPEHTFSKAFEVTPYALEAASRAKAFAEAIIFYKPKALYCDGVPELAIMARGMGLPVVLVHLPGNIMNDPTQVFAHHLADHIVAHFPSSLEQKNYQFRSKTFYSGYISKYSGDDKTPDEKSDGGYVTILLGYDNFSPSVLKNITDDLSTQFVIIGNNKEYDLGQNCKQMGRVKNISESIVGKRVISAAGQNTVAELLSLDKTIILLPEARPYDEQKVHANILYEKDVVLLAEENFTALQWRNLLTEAKTFKPLNENLLNRFPAMEIAEKMKKWYA